MLPHLMTWFSSFQKKCELVQDTKTKAKAKINETMCDPVFEKFNEKISDYFERLSFKEECSRAGVKVLTEVCYLLCLDHTSQLSIIILYCQLMTTRIE